MITLKIRSGPSGCPRAETPNERIRAVLSAPSTTAAQSAPILTARLKHPERNPLLSYTTLRSMA
jgi:hypothetical protein